MNNPAPTKQKVSFGRILAFSAPSLPLAAFGLPIVVQLPPYYVEYVGLSLGVAGTIFMAARILDVFIDFGLGILMDKTSTKIGRFTPYLLGGSPIMAFFVYMLFMAKPGASPYYLVFSLIGSYFAFSICMLAQLGVGNSLSHDYNERSRIFSLWQVGNIIGMLMVLAIPVIVEKMGGTTAVGTQSMGVFIMIMMPLTAIISFMFAKEGKPDAAAKHSDFSDIKLLLGIGAFRRLLLSDFTVSFAMGVTGGMFLFFLSAIKGFHTQSHALMLIYFVIGLLFTPLWTFISTKFGKHVAFGIAAIYTIISQSFLYFMPSGNFPIAALMIALAGIVYAAPILLLRAMVGDVGDEDKLKSGHDRTGLLFACMTLTSKAGYAVSVGVSYLLLDMIDFKSAKNAINTGFALNGLQMIFMGFPAIAYIIIILLMKNYPLTRSRVEDVQRQLAEKQS